MTQTAAIFLDAYRELHARRLFWITMILSGLVVVVFALIGINEQGLRLIVWDVPFPLNTTIVSTETFYKSMFLNFGVHFWLAWIATILALISTASIFPDYISGGAIDTVLSKPIGRMRLFLTKYLTGLMFVGLQVAVFSTAAFFLLGIRGGAWEPVVFLSVPLVVIFFSYLFCVCVLIGIVTRSTIAALLLTLLFWFFVFVVHAAESALLSFKLDSELQMRATQDQLEHDELILTRMRELEEPNEASITRFELSADEKRQQLDDGAVLLRRLTVAHNVTIGIKTVLPKTAETVALLERSLIDMAELPLPEEDGPGAAGPGAAGPERQANAGAVQRELVETIRERSIWWVVGTSLLFEAFVVFIAGLIFVRRDF